MADVKRIGPEEALAKLAEGYTYVDVRTEAEFADGHPAGAVNVPLLVAAPAGRAPNTDFLRVINACFPRDAKLVVGCQGGGRSLRAAQQLLADGYADVLDQRAGWGGVKSPFGELKEPGWGPAGLPQESGEPAGRSYADLKKKASP